MKFMVILITLGCIPYISCQEMNQLMLEETKTPVNGPSAEVTLTTRELPIVAPVSAITPTYSLAPIATNLPTTAPILDGMNNDQPTVSIFSVTPSTSPSDAPSDTPSAFPSDDPSDSPSDIPSGKPSPDREISGAVTDTSASTAMFHSISVVTTMVFAFTLLNLCACVI
jgi:hypothetical protein